MGSGRPAVMGRLSSAGSTRTAAATSSHWSIKRWSSTQSSTPPSASTEKFSSCVLADTTVPVKRTVQKDVLAHGAASSAGRVVVTAAEGGAKAVVPHLCCCTSPSASCAAARRESARSMQGYQ